MRRAMAEAEVGDEQRFADPTVNALQERVAELLGHEAALFLPTGTMCNQIGIRLHVRPGEALLVHASAHPIIAEGGGPAAHAGAMIVALEGEGGMFDADALRGAFSTQGSRYEARSALVSVEQTTNMGGGRVWPLDRMRGVVDAARERGLRTHLDGARLMNAAVAAGVPASDYAAMFDTAWIDFSKGLGAPMGACLAGSAELIEEAWRFKQMMGGALRQAGIVAAAGLYALDHNVDRLAEDHANARALAEGLAELPGAALDPATVETNIVIFDVDDAPRRWAELAEAGVEVTPVGPTRLRAVTHLDVDRPGIDRALEAFRRVLG
ncbi:MAG: beta-eliminating lyase-related protein [Actinomycetota bacterium]|nr:beta-eliminating lyase-related protein [Actinomycetota bacterium]